MRMNESDGVRALYPDTSELNSLWYEGGLGLLWFAMNNPKFSILYGYGAINLLHVRMKKYRKESFIYGLFGTLVSLTGIFGIISTGRKNLLVLPVFGLMLIAFSVVMQRMRKEEKKSISNPDLNPRRIQAFKTAFDWGRKLGYIIKDGDMWKLNEEALKIARGKKIIRIRLKRAAGSQGVPQGKDNGLEHLLSLL